MLKAGWQLIWSQVTAVDLSSKQLVHHQFGRRMSMCRFDVGHQNECHQQVRTIRVVVRVRLRNLFAKATLKMRELRDALDIRKAIVSIPIFFKVATLGFMQKWTKHDAFRRHVDL